MVRGDGFGPFLELDRWRELEIWGVRFTMKPQIANGFVAMRSVFVFAMREKKSTQREPWAVREGEG